MHKCPICKEALRDITVKPNGQPIYWVQRCIASPVNHYYYESNGFNSRLIVGSEIFRFNGERSIGRQSLRLSAEISKSILIERLRWKHAVKVQKEEQRKREEIEKLKKLKSKLKNRR